MAADVRQSRQTCARDGAPAVALPLPRSHRRLASAHSSVLLLACAVFPATVPIADAVSCGQHSAPNCGGCPRGHGRTWCNGDCVWDDRKNACVPQSEAFPSSPQSDDLYELLEIDDNADESQIKKAYRRLSVVYHPDKNRKKGRTTNEAWELYDVDTLCPEKDRITDFADCKTAHGALKLSGRVHPLPLSTPSFPQGCFMLPNGLKLHFNKHEGGAASRDAKPICRSSGREALKRFNAIRDAYEILSNPIKRVLYDTGGLEAVKQSENGQLEEGENIEQELEVKLQEFYRGKKQFIQVRRRVICRRCRKTRDRRRCAGCTPCPGKKFYVQRIYGGMVHREERTEPSTEDCRWENKELEVIVERGSSPGDRVEFKHMASQLPNQIPGHVIVNLKEKKPTKASGWIRRGDDLQHPVRLTLRDSLVGFSRSFKHFDNHTVEFSTESITTHGQIIRIEGEGMPIKDYPGHFGNLELVAEVQYPQYLSKADRDELMEVKALQKQVLRKTPPSPTRKVRDEF